MRRRRALGLLAALLAGCAAGRRQPVAVRDWLLVQPPEVADPHAPGGRRLLPSAPVADWRRADAFATEAVCEEARHVRATAVLDRARAALGDEARFDLGVRRAVNARCVRAEALAP